MTQTAFRTDPLSPELNHLINDYPRDAWDAHPNFARSTQNWLGAHQAFRQLSDICVSKTERILDKDMDAEHYGHILGRYGDSLVRNLHGHHTWEDRQFFPELANADPRFETGLDLLEQDHEVLDETLDRFTRASNRYLKLLDLDPTSADQELGDIHTAGCQIQSLLSRHLQDEEDLIVPIILHHKLRGSHLLGPAIVGFKIKIVDGLACGFFEGTRE